MRGVLEDSGREEFFCILVCARVGARCSGAGADRRRAVAAGAFALLFFYRGVGLTVRDAVKVELMEKCSAF